MLRRVIGGAASVALLALLPAGPATASGPSGTCTHDGWQTSEFPLGWQPGDPMDPNGENVLLQIGVAGTIEEFGSLEAGLAAFGFPTLEDFYAAVVDPNFNKIDHNDDGVLCFKRFSENGNKAAYLANAVDNTSHSRQ